MAKEQKLSEAQKIMGRYFKFMAACMTGEEDPEPFIKHDKKRRRKLASFGMKIPKEVGILLDPNFQSWPAILMKVKPGHHYNERPEYIIIELRNSIMIPDKFPFDGDISEFVMSWKCKIKELKEIEGTTPLNPSPIIVAAINMEEKLANFDVIIRLPFIQTTSDLLGKVTFDDGEEIIMSSC